MPVVNPGIRRQVAGAITRLFNSAAFALPLTHTAVPTRGSITPTFTRATTETGQKYDEAGYLDFTALAGEIVFKGARRVRNLLTFTEDIGNAAWTKRETTYSGGRLIEAATTADHSVWQAASTTTGSYYVASGHAKADQNSVIQITFSSGQVSGDPKANFNLSTGALGTVDAGLTAEIEAAPDIGAGYYRFSVKAQAASTSLTAFLAMVPLPTSVRLANYAGNVSNGLYLNKMQIEDVTGQTTQTASEYVSVGVESAPAYHGSMVDGVKCYNTDRSGNLIPTSGSHPLVGYVPWEARTNSLLHARDLSNAAWVKVNCTGVKDAVGSDGVTNSASTLTATGANATILQTLVLAAAARSYSVKIKRKTGTGAVSICRDGVTFTDVTSQINSSTYTTVKIENTSVLNPVCGIKLATSGDAVYVDWNQDEAGAFSTPSIDTTTIAVARNASVLTYSGGNVANLKTLAATFSRGVGVGSSGWVVGLSDGTTSNISGVRLTSATDLNFAGNSGGVSQWNTSTTPVYTSGATSKTAASTATNDIKMDKDGVAQTADTTATVPAVTQLNVGHIATLLVLNGPVNHIYGWTRNLSQSELGAVDA